MTTIDLRAWTRLTVILLIAAANNGATAGTVSNWKVTWDTSALDGIPDSGPFYLFIGLTNGGGANSSSKVTLSSFQLPPAAPTTPRDVWGGASGSIDTSIVLTDSEFDNGFVQRILPSSTFSFMLKMDISPDGGPFPDLFSIALLAFSDRLSNLDTIPTMDPDLANAFLRTNLTAPGLNFELFRSLSLDGGALFVPAPMVQPVGQVPEALSIVLTGSGLVGVGFLRSRRPRSFS